MELKVYYQKEDVGVTKFINGVFLALFALDAAPPKSKATFSMDSIPVEGGDWTMWSDCTPGKTESVRFRNCREVRIHKCPKETTPCPGSGNEVVDPMHLKSKNKNEGIL